MPKIIIDSALLSTGDVTHSPETSRVKGCGGTPFGISPLGGTVPPEIPLYCVVHPWTPEECCAIWLTPTSVWSSSWAVLGADGYNSSLN